MKTPAMRFEEHLQRLEAVSPYRIDGRVNRISGMLIEASGNSGTVGGICDIVVSAQRIVKAEIVGFKNRQLQLIALGNTIGIAPGNPVRFCSRELEIAAGPELLGRIIDGMGQPIDDKGPLRGEFRMPVYNEPPKSLARQRIDTVLQTGVRAIDGFISLGRGQRIGIFSGSGVGKSILLGMLARHSDTQINVIALVGERGREVREFIERDLGEEALKRSVVVVATSDRPPTVRIKAAQLATRIAEFFRDEGKQVLLMMDSLTRVAMAQREIGLTVGEPPATKGYTPSVFAMLPSLLERAGNAARGSITGMYTVLVEGDDLDEPISDAARSILDGHIVLKRELAVQGHYPAIAVLESISRVKNEVIDKEHLETATRLIELMAIYEQSEDLISIGAYKKGTDPKIDLSIVLRPKLNRFLRQDPREKSDLKDTLQHLMAIDGGAK